MVANSKTIMSKLVSCVSKNMVKEFITTMLVKEMYF